MPRGFNTLNETYKVELNLKSNMKTVGSLLCLILFIPTLSITSRISRCSNDPGDNDSFNPKLAVSGTITLNYGGALTISGFSNRSIEWTYICSPINTSIEVRVLNTSQYNEYKKDSIFRNYFTLSNVSDNKNMGKFSVPYPDKWYLSFCNLDPARLTINLTFNVKFHNLYRNNPADFSLLGINLVIPGIIIAILSSVCTGIVFVIFLQKRHKKRMLETLQNTINEDEMDSIE